MKGVSYGLPSQNKEHCIVLYCIAPEESFCGKDNREGLDGVVGPKPLTITSFGCLKHKTEIFYWEE